MVAVKEKAQSKREEQVRVASMLTCVGLTRNASLTSRFSTRTRIPAEPADPGRSPTIYSGTPRALQDAYWRHCSFVYLIHNCHLTSFCSFVFHR